ncbi:hypothetical protein SAMN05443144_12088 [Fodinibius roseus]|uniref:Uncharacterized protein n=1 Tax=Fodinibius roseus TaxID=1194090 RepID=A0A1M5HMM1_9BACT|nr:hypothetical protein SAMN05443144_12088 [Fodinibius roseus]
MIDLLVGFLEALKYHHIQPGLIGEVETNLGVIWFEDESGITYCVSIQTVEHKGDESC